ncbi:uncharacterized protein LOC116415607 [Apis florea]|uniref:uncharacterized protein LOC116415607 n=1 Tax=Apis florea TaxID=7463 RepID=UPI0012FE884A|nr:uncharacterized protein LOC116415607 [Apis florea]
MPFHSLCYDFRFPRYHRVKKRQMAEAIPEGKRMQFQKEISITGLVRNLCYNFKHYGHFERLYLGNRLRYRDESKSESNGMVSSSTSRILRIFGVDGRLIETCGSGV